MKSGTALAGLAAAPAWSMSARRAEPVGVAVIGTGSRGQEHAAILAARDDAELVACCDVLPFRLAEALARAGPGVDGHSDYRRVLDDPRVEAVIVATPFYLHAQPMIDALDAGKHVYCEKTAVKGYEQIAAVRAAIDDTDRVIQVGYQFRHSRLYEHVVGRIRDGEIGVVGRIECHWNRDTDWRRSVPSPDLERAINWRMYREYSGGLAAELSSHQMDFCNWLLGARPLRVMGSGGIDYWKDGRETRDNIQLLVAYDNGVEATFSCLTTNAHNGYLIKVLGSEGTVFLKPEEAWIARPGMAAQTGVDAVSGATLLVDNVPARRIELEHMESTAQALADFVTSVRGGERPRASIEFGLLGSLLVQKSLDAMDHATVETVG